MVRVEQCYCTGWEKERERERERERETDKDGERKSRKERKREGLFNLIEGKRDGHERIETSTKLDLKGKDSLSFSL